MRMVLLGPPGAGKGTLAGLIKEKFGLLHISTGDLLREEMKSGSELGKEAKGYVESGGLVPDDVVTRLIENKLKTAEGAQNGYMLDGFPRTIPQANELDRILTAINQPLDYALYMEASLPVVLQRLTGRRVCKSCGALYHLTNMPPKEEGTCDACGGELYQRADDNEETIKNRMAVYEEKTAAIIKFYEDQGKLKKVNADLGTDELLKTFTGIFNEHQAADPD